MQLQLNRQQITELRNIINEVWDNPAIKAPDMYKVTNERAKAAGIFEEHQEFSDEGYRQSLATINDPNRNFANFASRKRKLTVSVDFNLVEDTLPGLESTSFQVEIPSSFHNNTFNPSY